MADKIRCDSCGRTVPYEPDHTGHLTLSSPPGLDRHWPKTHKGEAVAVLCASCIARLQIHLFGPSARRQRLSIDPDGPGQRVAVVEAPPVAAQAAETP